MLPELGQQTSDGKERTPPRCAKKTYYLQLRSFQNKFTHLPGGLMLCANPGLGEAGMRDTEHTIKEFTVLVGIYNPD